jgi:drug/metabolite transporter (DMT)-like permease
LLIRGIPYLILATLLWSGNYIAGRILAPAMPALFLNGVRWSLSAIELLIIFAITGRRIPLIRKWKELLLLGFIGMFVFSSLNYLGLHTIPAAQAGIISGLIPVTILIFGVFILHERPKTRAWLGTVLSVLGVGLLFGLKTGSKGYSVSLGDVEMLLAAISWGWYTVLGKKFGKDLTPLQLTAGAAVYGAIFSDIAGIFSYSPSAIHMTNVDWIALVYVSTAASVIAYFVWTFGVERIGASKSAPFMNLLPVWTVILGVILLGEHMTGSQIIGGVIILLGAIIASTSQKAPQVNVK